jgi:type 1 fimbria pilin
MAFIYLVLSGVMLLFAVPSAHADCSPAVNLGDVPVSFPSTISVPANAAVGTVVAAVTVPIPGATAGVTYASCSGSGNIYWAIRAGTVIANRVGTTSVAGIGYTSSLSGGGFSGNVVMDTTLNATSLPGGLSAPQFQSQLYLTVNLVKTGPVTPGPLTLNPSGSSGLPGVVAVFFAGDGGQSVFRSVLASNATSIATSACSVTTPSINVALAPVKTSAFQGVGSTAGTQPLALGLTCPSPNVRVFVTLTDNTTPTNTSNMLSLKPDSTAQGVRLQILSNGTPVSFGPDSTNAGNTNQWLVGTSTGGPMSVPLSVQYIESASQVTPGKVDAVATFTMSYQ